MEYNNYDYDSNYEETNDTTDFFAQFRDENMDFFNIKGELC